MSRQRYEPIPQQTHREEVIILDSIHNSPAYNYNSGIPNSISSAASVSSRTPSLIAPSIPNSPPPSFHTHSSPGTPRPNPSTGTRQSVGGGASYAELWGVAPSTVGGDGMTEIGMGTSNDALATIAGLKQRIEWLEESIGKLLLERDSHVCNSNSSSPNSNTTRDNCCVTFTDASPDLERILTQGKGTNCCVQFRRNDAKHANQRTGILVGFGTLLIVFVLIIVLVGINAGERGGGGRGGDRPVIYGEDRS